MRAEIYHRTIVSLLVLLLGLPVAATLAYSFATRWGATVLPDGFTLSWYVQLWQDQRFLAAFFRSLVVGFGTLAIGTVVVVPAAFVVFYRFPALDKVMGILSLVPFAVPPVVSSVGLLHLYSDGPLPLVGTPWILVGCDLAIVLPFLYRAQANALGAINLRDLMDAAHILGAGTARAFLMVVFPLLRKGLMASLFLSFSLLLGEFVFANILVGTRYETLQVYLYNVRQVSGHFTSAAVMSYFFFTLVLTWLAARLGR
ncbi:ABC transporter permease subunit [Telmatospirillum sp.]|uniref:ABC transporter permease n=1 Tax=Telmatospirillum sp. TaxID=2079197 RepID=UPI00284FBB38|nr:ABC transporter permease subunit [Telmatospirillum sp.]MDR3438334.1 ABC transporter permease subunit [Telmatospirillum sp.]